MDFFENLIEDGLICPPSSSLFASGQTFYRIVKQDPASSECFHSYKRLHPEKSFPDECIEKAVSIYDNLDTLVNGYFKTPAGKKKKILIGELILNNTDGKINKTFGPGHFSWWRAATFNVNTVITKSII